jgi:hypothetical protein
MKSYRIPILLASSLFCILPVIFAQGGSSFDIDAYKLFLASHQNMSSEQLRSMYSAGSFTERATTIFSASLYSDSLQSKYKLTDHEKSLIEKHGFMVTERLKCASFGEAFGEIFHNDLPVFVSTDAILHAVHMSYDEILKTVEEDILIAKLDSLLARLHTQLPALALRYAFNSAMKQQLIDLDVYLSIPRILLGNPVAPLFTESAVGVDALLSLIKAEQPREYKLFSDTTRFIDFSQFTVRGHYTQSERLKKYFQAMIWLGRTEMYLVAPVNSTPPQADEDIQRQTIDAVLLAEAAQESNAYPLLEEIDNIIRFFVGESDNVTLPNIRTLIQATLTDSASQLLDVQRWKDFQNTLKQKSFAFQRILSQIIISDPTSPDDIRPASSFLLLGQRFVIDSYVTGSVVYDKIKFEDKKVWRALPSSFDVLFSLGNNAAAQLLESELATYHYTSNLAALRYLVDSYESEFWKSTLYNNWLNSIRVLNPPVDRTTFPRFMQTAAWWQEKMNTQLASWAQLRHDNLLYAKQSYTGGVVCSFPESYVEPIPEFYGAVKTFASTAAEKLESVPFTSSGIKDVIVQYWKYLGGVVDTLETISQKELANTPLSDRDKDFLRRMLYLRGICGPEFDGWYYRLYYTGETGFTKEDLVVADVHTCPTDELGGLVGWVMHAGTGPVNLAVVTTDVADGRTISFVGPVMSYYEHVSTNFKRLTDEEWRTMFADAPSMRPAFVNLYLADSTGSSKGEGPSLVTGVDIRPPQNQSPTSLVLGQNFPNPFNPSTIITFIIPEVLTNSPAELAVYDVQGRLVKRLLSQKMPAGNYTTRWDGTIENGKAAATGVYFYHLTVGNQRQIGKMSLIK